jgi:hypothetical protein
MDTDALAKALNGGKGVFLMSPPNYDPEPGFPQTVKSIAAVTAAINVARPEKVVFPVNRGRTRCRTDVAEQLEDDGRSVALGARVYRLPPSRLVHGEREAGR